MQQRMHVSAMPASHPGHLGDALRLPDVASDGPRVGLDAPRAARRAILVHQVHRGDVEDEEKSGCAVDKPFCMDEGKGVNRRIHLPPRRHAALPARKMSWKKPSRSAPKRLPSEALQRWRGRCSSDLCAALPEALLGVGIVHILCSAGPAACRAGLWSWRRAGAAASGCQNDQIMIGAGYCHVPAEWPTPVGKNVTPSQSHAQPRIFLPSGGRRLSDVARRLSRLSTVGVCLPWLLVKVWAQVSL